MGSSSRASMTLFAPAEVQAMQRADFYSFLMRCFAELHGGQEFSPAWHAEVLAAKLQGVGEGSVKRLVVNVPPRHLKSLAASVALPAWLLGHDPALAIVNVTYAQDLSEKFARDCRAVMASDWYRALFTTRLASPREPLAELATTRGGFRLATSVGGVLTGRGADVILIDDPLKPTDAMSQSRRVAANDWFDSTLYSRLNDKAKGRIVIVMQRLHEDDLAGHVLKQGGWELVSFPAIAEDDELRVVETLFGGRECRRTAGEALDPAREPLATLERIRETIGPPVPAAAGAGRRGHDQGGLAPALSSRGSSAKLRPDSSELGHRQQALRAFRLFRLHHLGPQKLAFLSARRAAQETVVPRAQARRDRPGIAVSPRGDPDRGPGFRNAAHPGADRGGLFARDPLRPGGRQDHAAARPDGDDRERFCLAARESPVARRLPRRAHDFSRRPPRRPGRLDRPGARLDEAEAGGSGGMDRVLWEAGGVEAIGLQVVTIQYWRPELGCREWGDCGRTRAVGGTGGFRPK